VEKEWGVVTFSLLKDFGGLGSGWGRVGATLVFKDPLGTAIKEKDCAVLLGALKDLGDLGERECIGDGGGWCLGDGGVLGEG
jgi:hypothetical protein